MSCFEPVWFHDLHQRGSSSTFLTHPALVVQERRTRVTRLDPRTGHQLWEARCENPWGTLAASEAGVFYLNQHQRLQCFGLETGDVQWDIVLPSDLANHSATYGNLIAVGNSVLVGGWRRYTRLLCLRSDGTMSWVYERLHDYAPPIPGPWGIAVVCTRMVRRDVALVDVETGRTLQDIAFPVALIRTIKARPYSDTAIGSLPRPDRVAYMSLIL